MVAPINPYADLGGDFYTRRSPDKVKDPAIDPLRRLDHTAERTCQRASSGQGLNA
jgi:hypothetical protein